MKKPWLRGRDKCWYVEVDGKQVKLGPDKAVAFEQYHKIMADGQVSTKTTITVHETVVLFLEWLVDHSKERTYGFYADHLLCLTDFVSPKLKVRELTAVHIDDWIKGRYRTSKPRKLKDGSFTQSRPVSDNHRHNAIRCLKRCFKWAKGRYTDINPVADVETYPATRRDTYVTPEDYDKLYAAINDENFREFVQMMRLTGCRPQEVRLAEKRHFDHVSSCLDFPKGEIKGSKENRVVLLEGEALLIVQRRAAKHQRHLFLNSDGNVWTKDAIVQRFADLSVKAGVKVTSYTIRHAWATDALARGVPIQFVARIMGHKGTRVLMEVYNHLEKKQDDLRSALKRANGAA